MKEAPLQKLKRQMSEPATKENLASYAEKNFKKYHSKSKALKKFKPKGYPEKFTSAEEEATNPGHNYK